MFQNEHNEDLGWVFLFVLCLFFEWKQLISFIHLLAADWFLAALVLGGQPSAPCTALLPAGVSAAAGGCGAHRAPAVGLLSCTVLKGRRE